MQARAVGSASPPVHVLQVNVDYNCVGWYQSTYLGTYSNAMFIETQFNHQDTIGNNAVVLVYDPLQTTRGNLCLKAFRLTQAFMDNFRKLSAKGRETT